MSQLSKIEWTDATWNPMRGCRRVSPGCENCYAERLAVRLAGQGRPYEGLAKSTKGGPRWTGQGRFVRDLLTWPLTWTGAPQARAEGRPSRIFVNSMSDLFFEGFTFEEIAAVFGVIACCPQHVFQVLTKRPKRALEFYQWAESLPAAEPTYRAGAPIAGYLGEFSLRATSGSCNIWLKTTELPHWPLPNVWIGVSAEDQQRADERIPLLLQIPAAVRFVSYEPALGPVDFEPWLRRMVVGPADELTDEMVEEGWSHPGGIGDHDPIDFLIVGGESGPGARLCDVAWLRGAVAQARDTQTPVFVKQLGADAHMARCHYGCNEVADCVGNCSTELNLRHSKGGDPAEWPEGLRVREFPRVAS